MPRHTTHHPRPSAVGSTVPNPPFLSTFCAAGIDAASGASDLTCLAVQMSLSFAFVMTGLNRGRQTRVHLTH